MQFLEAHLAGALKPMRPSNVTLQRVNRRMRLPNREEIRSRLSDWGRLGLIFGGVLSGMLLLITVARALYYLSGRRG